MSYIDYNMASLEEREVFSITKSMVKEIYENLAKDPRVLGSVLIATCNRTEFYMSLQEGVELSPFQVLCDYLKLDHKKYSNMAATLHQDQVMIHLCKVACGAESQIWGEDQIISQVRDAIKTAQQLKASDTLLNVMFRLGVTAGKKIKTLVDFKVHDNSTAARAVAVIKEQKDIEKVLVIGNGMIGRLVASLLVKAGKKPTMTLRQYKYGEIVIPRGVETVNYMDRYKAIEESHAVISATLSPHYAVDIEKMLELTKVPKVFIDLAVPRDIAPEVAKLEGVSYHNVDSISRGERSAKQQEQLAQIEVIIMGFIREFHRWYDYKLMLEERGLK